MYEGYHESREEGGSQRLLLYMAQNLVLRPWGSLTCGLL